ncbi:MAG: hypothetical protein SFY67_13055 [Candidatus Melainabacteria bacterium]|nr:hypothetical protein [Candidatus Melainabacteria bacterium]
MFDYHAGEKFKIVIIGTAACAFLAGVLLMGLLGGGGEPAHITEARKKHKKMHTDQGVISSDRAQRQGYQPTDVRQPEEGSAQNPMGGVQPPGGGQAPADYAYTEPLTAQNLIEEFLPYSRDFSAGSATQSQERAILCMTPECAQAYRASIWTKEMAAQIENSGLKSNFTVKNIKVAGYKPDGAVVIEVEGTQVLEMEGKGQKNNSVKMEYLVKNVGGQIRITGINEVGG